MATRSDVALLVGQELRVLEAGESLTPDDETQVLIRLDSVRAWLIEEGLCYWDAESIPDAAKLPLSKIVAHECRNLFGVTYDAGQEGMQQLRVHCAKRASGEAGQANYF